MPPAVFYGKNTDRRGCTNCEWNSNHWQATCGTSEAAVGLSKSNDNTFTHALLCKNVGAGALGNEARKLPFNSDSPNESRAYKRSTNVDPNWDTTSSVKLECGLNEYVSGVSQNKNYFPPHTYFSNVRCSSGLGSASGCQRQLIQEGGYSGAWGDWDYSYRKADCPSGKVMVGITVDNTRRRPNSFLCCNQGTTTRYEAEATSGVSIPNGSYVTRSDEQASQGLFEQPINSDPNATSLSWTQVASSATATRTLEFAVRSTNGTNAKMGVSVNGQKSVIQSASTNWQIVSVTAQLYRSSANVVTLTNSEGANPLQLDYMQITVP